MPKNLILAALCAASLAMNDSPGAMTCGAAGTSGQEVSCRPAGPEGPKIEAGTPEIYRRPYLSDHTPVAIYRDGRQVYEGLPLMIRQADGTLRQVATRVEIEPATSAPVEPASAITVRR